MRTNHDHQIRIAAAQTLFLLSGNRDLKAHDWTQSLKSLKPIVESLKLQVDVP